MQKRNTSFSIRNWPEWPIRHPWLLLLAAMVFSAGLLGYTVDHFRINANMTDMISNKLPFRRAYKDFLQSFPELQDKLVVVVDAPTPALARYYAEQLATRVRQEKKVFRSVELPEGGKFFERNGLLFLNLKDLETFSDHLAEMQPFLTRLSRDLSLHGFFSVLSGLVSQGGEQTLANKRIQTLFNRLQGALAATAKGRPYPVSWQEIMTGQKVKASQRQEFVLTDPILDYNSLAPAQKAITNLRGVLAQIRSEPGAEGVHFGLTGGIALRNADLEAARSGIEIASVLSFIFVALLLYIGLRSWRMVLASLVALLIGLIWTLGFAIVFIGSLNLISVTFVVLFIGLGVDYSIQVCLRFRELYAEGIERLEALRDTVVELRRPLLLCSLTTSIGFYAFVPTAYSGASELGIISGTGMFFILAVNLLLMPAMLRILFVRQPTTEISSFGIPLASFPARHSKLILFGTTLLTLVALALMPQVRFDYNPLNLSNPKADAVKTTKKLFTSGQTSPWTISVIKDSLPAAERLATSLNKLPEVAHAVTVADFVPAHQKEKLGIISDTSLFMPPLPSRPTLLPVRPKRAFSALASLGRSLHQLTARVKTPPPSATRLASEIDRFLQLQKAPQKARTALSLLHRGMLFELALALQPLNNELHGPRVFGIKDLPARLRGQYVTAHGRYRVQVFPKANLTVEDNLVHFVDAVRKIAPNATDAPVTILQTSRAIVSSFQTAALYALVAITILLLLVLRRVDDTILMLIPLLLGILFTSAFTVLLNIPFNFANVIVIPLLLGVGIDYGIHLITRFRVMEAGVSGLLSSSTARAVLFSALTTVVSFSSLSFSAHRGTASMGILLTICNLLMILCTLTILPAILHEYAMFRRRRERR